MWFIVFVQHRPVKTTFQTALSIREHNNFARVWYPCRTVLFSCLYVRFRFDRGRCRVLPIEATLKFGSVRQQRVFRGRGVGPGRWPSGARHPPCGKACRTHRRMRHNRYEGDDAQDKCCDIHSCYFRVVCWMDLNFSALMFLPRVWGRDAHSNSSAEIVKQLIRMVPGWFELWRWCRNVQIMTVTIKYVSADQCELL